MRQVVFPRLGPPSVLTVREAVDPVPGPREVRIKVTRAGVNFADVLARMGLYPGAPDLPAVVGYEVAGTIDAPGDGVAEWKPGDRVMALCNFGGYSEKVVTRASRIFPIPAGWSDAEGAAFLVNYLAAGAMLIGQANFQPGETVLIHGAGGGVGLAALQLCRWRGAVAIGTSGEGKRERLKERGLNHWLDSHQPVRPEAVKQLTGGKGADVVLDPVGADSFRRSYESLAPLGRLVMYGASSLAPGKARSWPAAIWGFLRMPRFGALNLIEKNRAVMGFHAGRLPGVEARLKPLMGELLRLAGEGHLRPVIDSTHPFADASAAHARMQERKNFGKVLLAP